MFLFETSTRNAWLQASSAVVLVASLVFRCELPRVPVSAKLQAKSQRLEAVLEYLGARRPLARLSTRRAFVSLTLR